MSTDATLHAATDHRARQARRSTLALATSALFVVPIALTGAVSASAATTTENVFDIDGAPWDDVGRWATDHQADGTPAITTTYGDPNRPDGSALELRTPTSDDKVQVLLNLETPLPATDLEAVGYSVLRSSDSTAADHLTPSIQLVVDWNGGTLEDGGYATLVYEPVYNDYPTAGPGFPTDEWVTIDALDDGEATWWSSRIVGSIPNHTYVSFDTFTAANPDMVILRAGVGQGSGNPGLLAAADLFTLNDTTYDFAAMGSSAEDCKKGGWVTNFPADMFRNQGDCVSSFR